MQDLLAVRQVLHYLPDSQSTEKGWTPHEQQLFWVALTKFPRGPWTDIAEYIGTKTTRQAMTHAQKLRQKLKRWNSRLRSNPAVNSLMDGVASDNNATVSVNAAYDTAPQSVSFEPPPSLPMGIETKFDSQQDASSPPSIHCERSSQIQQQQIDRIGPLSNSVAFVLGLRSHSQVYGAEHAMSPPQHDEGLTSIPFDFLDELTKALSEEDAGEEEEVTEEELKELDDGDVVD
ncbi:hypothetical protein P3T76_011321 [Phytophthora citrophthora]|uniref:Myb-like domain-containing protein n=1 Tax=Phytophthora citrophthora TaxID=4793 RepID=A0AAD9LEZ2_9STRA|nr:hypothetical protein P3T76_011321 [Phytophthora citrophthora]